MLAEWAPQVALLLQGPRVLWLLTRTSVGQGSKRHAQHGTQRQLHLCTAQRHCRRVCNMYGQYAITKPASCAAPHLRATAAANLFSPPTLLVTSLYTGPVTWLDRWLLPSCWMALSADQGSSMVRCSRRRWLRAVREACSEMPVLAASLMMATSLEPSMKQSFSRTAADRERVCERGEGREGHVYGLRCVGGWPGGQEGSGAMGELLAHVEMLQAEASHCVVWRCNL